MPSPEGRGIAQKAWKRYVGWVEKNVSPMTDPVVRPVATRYAVDKVETLTGFWVLWHGSGGYEGLVNLGMHPSTVYRRIRAFRLLFGEHPDEYQFPGLTLDLKKWNAPALDDPGDTPIA